MSVLILLQASILIQVAKGATNVPSGLQPKPDDTDLQQLSSTNINEGSLKQDILSTTACPFLRKTRSVIPNSYSLLNPCNTNNNNMNVPVNCNNVNLNLPNVDQTNQIANVGVTNVDCNNAVNPAATAPYKIGPLSITSIAENQPGLIIKIDGDKLVVGGSIKVKGQIPIYGSVAVSGNVPNDCSSPVNLQVLDSIVNLRQ